MKSLYVHIPFCVKKCNYCDFASFGYKSRETEEKYTNALLREFKTISYKQPLDTIYIGGGTPTVLSIDGFEKVLLGIHRNFDVEQATEFTVEANPLTVNEDTIKLLKQYGVNRISMGVQSANDKELKMLGRIHSFDEAVDTYNLIRHCGISNINLDLMFGLPGQDIKSLENSINKILELEPEHISCYGLKIEEGTPFYKMLLSGEIKEADDDLFADMYDLVKCTLKDRGMQQYEISNFSKAGFESKHNIKYWTQGEYFGAGLGASSFINGTRYTNTSNFREYINSDTAFLCDETEKMNKNELMSEYMILGLRLTQIGVNKQDFYNKFGVFADDVFKPQIEKFAKLGLINSTQHKIVLTSRAYYISNSILCEFMQ